MSSMKALAVYWRGGQRFSTYIEFRDTRQFLRDLSAHERHLERLVQCQACEGYVIYLEGEISRNAGTVPHPTDPGPPSVPPLQAAGRSNLSRSQS